MLELQEAMERREETVRDLMTKLSESESEQINAKQDATLETKELTEQIKMLQEQLVQVGKALQEAKKFDSQIWSGFIFPIFNGPAV